MAFYPLANKVKADRIIQLTNNEKGVSNSGVNARMKVSDLIDLYENWLKDNGKTMGKTGLTSLKHALSQYKGENVTIKQVDRDFCKGFFQFLRSEYVPRTKLPLATNTIATYSGAFSTALNWAVRNDYIRENPFNKISSTDKVFMWRVQGVILKLMS